MNRNEKLQRIRENPKVSVLIVGAGINGIGTFRDLGLQGVDVLLIDRSDYSSGASAASSHMVHGGIRYLENGEFKLVKEAVQERNRLIENAPHLVKPLPTVFPIFKRFSGILNAPLKFLGLLDRPSERGALVIKIGMMVYDAFTRTQGTVPPHQFFNRGESHTRFPHLNPDAIYTGVYFDASMPSPERIALELVLDAEASSDQAAALNYASLVSAQDSTVAIRDELTGDTFEIQPEIIINAGGPWIDHINLAAGQPSGFVGGTKGSHLVIDHPILREAIGENEFFFENKDGRIVLIFPIEDRVIIGTSDIRIDDPDDACITEEEIDYFFGMIGKVFPGIQLDRSQILFTFSGVRPLPASKSGFTGQISRNHSIEVLEPTPNLNIPIYSLVGGKWTTFRSFSEQVTDKVLDFLGKQRVGSTANIKIGGGAEYPADQAAHDNWIAKVAINHGLSPARVSALFDRYGTHAVKIAEFIDPRSDSALENLEEYSRDEIRYIVQQEQVLHLDDLLLRRTLIAMLGRLTPALLLELGQITASVLNWSQEMLDAEIDRSREILLTKHRIANNRYIP